jgi:hypothetical protein
MRRSISLTVAVLVGGLLLSSCARDSGSQDAGATSCRRQPGDHRSPGSELRRKEEVVDMAISLWVIVVVACCAPCAKGMATVVRWSRNVTLRQPCNKPGWAPSLAEV